MPLVFHLNSGCSTSATVHTRAPGQFGSLQNLRPSLSLSLRSQTIRSPNSNDLRNTSSMQCSASTQELISTPPATPPPITLSSNALSHLEKLRGDSGGAKMLLRVGVKSGGCSGMSYTMDFEAEENVDSSDTIMEYEAPSGMGKLRLVCNPKSLLYLFGMELDYSNALIGGGFQFQNPNAANSCGCGKSFGV